MMSTKSMFLARTKDENIFDPVNDEKKKKWLMQEDYMKGKLKGKME